MWTKWTTKTRGALLTQFIAKLEAQQAELLRLHLEEGDTTSPNAIRAERVRLREQIKAAKASLAATEEQLELDGVILRKALELAGDLAAVYAAAPDATKRGYNRRSSSACWSCRLTRTASQSYRLSMRS